MKHLILLFSILCSISVSAQDITFTEAFEWAKRLRSSNERAARIAEKAQQGRFDLSIFEKALNASSPKDYDLAEDLTQKDISIEAFVKAKELESSNERAAHIAEKAQQGQFDFNVFESVLKSSDPKDYVLAEALATKVSNSCHELDDESSINDSSRNDIKPVDFQYNETETQRRGSKTIGV